MLRHDLARRAVTSALAVVISLVVVAGVRLVLHTLFGRQDAPWDVVVSIVVILGLVTMTSKVSPRPRRAGF